jgi:hypothetical protein
VEKRETPRRNRGGTYRRNILHIRRKPLGLSINQHGPNVREKAAKELEPTDAVRRRAPTQTKLRRLLPEIIINSHR